MRERMITRSEPSPDLGPPQQKVLGIGHWPGRKGPVLYHGNEYCAHLVLTFRSEAQAEMFMELLVNFFDIKDGNE